MFINKILFRFAKLSYKSIIVIIAFQTVIALITSAASLITGQLISDFLSPADPIKSSITQKILMLIALMVIIALMGMYKGKLAIKAGIEVKNNVRSMLIQKLFLLGPCYLKDNRTGTLTSIMTSRVEWLMNYYVLYLPTVTSAIINAFVFIAFLIYVDIVTGLIGVISCIAKRKNRKFEKGYRKSGTV
ncbi:ABC transporter transmembrane region [Peptostreptococcaceae bacterium pGA-8]|nr:ABC transporter transmembrane region [Peptostreptococcaceae bacterium pGA-8]